VRQVLQTDEGERHTLDREDLLRVLDADRVLDRQGDDEGAVGGRHELVVGHRPVAIGPHPDVDAAATERGEAGEADERLGVGGAANLLQDEAADADVQEREQARVVDGRDVHERGQAVQVGGSLHRFVVRRRKRGVLERHRDPVVAGQGDQLDDGRVVEVGDRAEHHLLAPQGGGQAAALLLLHPQAASACP
jgi:hypothetical protein